jgi:hypothetical protein
MPVRGTIKLGTGAVKTWEERAWDLEMLQALNPFLSQCLSAEVKNPMVGHNQLPEWQQKSLPRLPDLNTADPVPNLEKLDKKWRFLRVAEAGKVSKQDISADCSPTEHLQRLWRLS